MTVYAAMTVYGTSHVVLAATVALGLVAGAQGVASGPAVVLSVARVAERSSRRTGRRHALASSVLREGSGMRNVNMLERPL